MNKHRACIIGLGRIASLFEDDEKRIHPCTHAGALVALEDVELVSGAARSEESALRFKNRWNLDRVYTDYVEMINSQYDPAQDVFHVMGEMCFSYALVNRLQKMGFICLASTSERIVKEMEPGRKEVFFKFVRFREYGG